MTITISKNELLSKLTSISKIISSKPVLPIMACILFDARDGKLYLSAASESGRIDTSIDSAQITEDIKVCFDAKLIIDALKTLPEQPITFTIDKTNFSTIIKHFGGKFELMGKDANHFPEQATIKEPTSLFIPLDDFVNGIDKVMPFAANDELRPVLNGVFVEWYDGNINFVASDTHRLGLCNKHVDENNCIFSFILPSKIAQILKSINPKHDESVEIEIGTSNKVKLYYEKYAITAILIEGKFPNYRSVMPKQNDKSAKINVSAFRGALNRTMIFTGQSKLLKLEFDFNMLKLSGKDTDFSTCADEQVSCEYQGEPISIGFNADWLHSILAQIDSDDLIITLSTPDKAALLYPDPNNDPEQTFLIMPLLIND